jgi:probable F420-dependent oxidoreductase
MRIGVVYPQTELGGDPAAVRKIALATEELGYDHVLVFDHVVGAKHDREPRLWGPYTERDPFHDPFVMFGYLAAITQRIDLVTGVLILPQRQTVLVAQQAADVDRLSGERLRLGVGVGWNYVEYEALGQDFRTRGRRIDEQVPLLRRLWTEALVTHEGEFDRIDRGCINPRPARQIPIWLGGFTDVAFRRGVRLGDGFIFAGDVDDCLEALARVRSHLREARRSQQSFGAELVARRARTPEETARTFERWERAGGSHASVHTMRLGLDSAEAHIDFLGRVRDRLRRSL